MSNAKEKYEQMHADYLKAKAAMRQARQDKNDQEYQEQRARKNEVKTALKHRLEDEHGFLVHPKRDVLFRLAWEFGHANGNEEVAHYYGQLADLLT